MSRTTTLACTAWTLVAILGARALGTPPVDPAVEPYRPVSGISGTLNSIGSDTLNNLMALWAEAFRRMYPNVKIQVEGKGSATAPPALAAGTAQLGPMSREMKAEEQDAFARRHGYRPTQVSVAIDCLAVYVHRDNPIEGLTLGQLDGIFSKTRKSGSPEISRWGELGLSGDWQERRIGLYGRNSASGTYAYFKEHVLLKGDFKDSVKEQPGSAAVINAVANDRAGIGYSGIGYKTSEVRAVALAGKPGEQFAEPSFENALAGKYPLGRRLYIYVHKRPNEPLVPLVREFIRFVLSRDGQQIVVRAGYGPLPASLIQRQSRLLQ
ncbi:MAG: PstS family phosphate ABC transporter substrate-binding protein [Thermoguttaceae bacterium]